MSEGNVVITVQLIGATLELWNSNPGATAANTQK